jgi:hypothetical protein
MSRPEKDEILEAVLARTAPPRSTRRFALGGFLAACGVAALLFMLRPGSIRRGELVARGTAVSSPNFTPFCTAGSICRSGARLAFQVEGAGRRYFAAYARRPDGAIVWYFPSEPDGVSRDLAARPASGGVLSEGIQLSDDHPPGRYEVFGVFSTRPLTRDEIKASTTGDRGVESIALVKKELSIR